jgi:NTE family protein/lysophospholipid hydrolase
MFTNPPHAHPPEEQQHLVAVLRAGKVFGQLPPDVLEDMANCLRLERVQGGHMVFAEGDVADSMLFVITGGLRVSRRVDGGLLLYNQIRVGESVGEIGLVLAQPRTADVVALRDSTLALLDRNSFQALMQRHPLVLSEAFVRATFSHLRHTPQLAETNQTHTFAVVPLHMNADAASVARVVAQALGGMGRVAHITPEHGFGLDAQQNLLQPLVEWGDALEAENDFVVYEAEHSDTPWTRRAFRLADQVVFVASAEDEPGVTAMQDVLAHEPGYGLKRAHLVLLHPPGAEQAVKVAQWRDLKHFERIYPLRQGHMADHARLARFLTGRAVGVVLGGGGARGFAHLGVLRALEEQGVPIDLVGGNSMGALLGALYACGMPLDNISEKVMAFASGGERLTLPLVSLVSGRRVERDLRRLFGDRTIDSLWLPYFAAACNLSQGCTTVLDRGPLWRAVLASNSPAGLFPPVPFEGDLLCDGAILDNVPVAAMRTRLGVPLEKRRGNGTVVAIDVDVQEDMVVDRQTRRLTMWGKLRSWLQRQPSEVPSIADILYRAGHIGGIAQRDRTMAAADLYLQPPVKHFALMDYKRAADIAEVGYRHALERLALWKHKV